MKQIRTFARDQRGDAVVEATVLFPIIILICVALVLLSIYLPMRAAMQRSTQLAATAIATQRSDTWLRFDPDTLKYEWLKDRSQLSNVYASLIGALKGGKGDEADAAEQAVMNMENKNIQKPSAHLNCTPFVRQYGILLGNGVFCYAKRSTKQTIYTGIQKTGD